MGDCGRRRKSRVCRRVRLAASEAPTETGLQPAVRVAGGDCGSGQLGVGPGRSALLAVPPGARLSLTRAVDYFQKRWKHFRDYYMKLKKEEKSETSDSSVKKRKRPPYFEILKFLDGIQDDIVPCGNVNEHCDQDASTELEQSASSEVSQMAPSPQPSTSQPHVTPQAATSQPSSSTSSSICDIQQLSLFEKRMVSLMQNEYERIFHLDPNKSFLLSLLPEIESMTPSQQFDFKLQVMNVIRNIKYPASVPHQDYRQSELLFGQECSPSTQNLPRSDTNYMTALPIKISPPSVSSDNEFASPENGVEESTFSGLP